MRVRGGTIPAQAEADIRSALEEVEDARSYAAEIAQGVSHYPHEEAEPCVRCRAERAEAEVARLQGSIASYQAAAHNYVNEHAEVARLKVALRGKCDEYKMHDPGWCAFCDAARTALRGGGEHSKHPTGDYCVYCLSQWPCVEAGEQ